MDFNILYNMLGLWTFGYVLLGVITVLVLALLILCLHIYYVHQKYCHLPGPARASFFLGHIPLFSKGMKEGKENILLIRQWSLEFDGLFVLWIFWKPTVIVYDKTTIKDVIITYNLPKANSFSDMVSEMFGVRYLKDGLESLTDHDDWKKKRAAINPAFAYSNLKTLISNYNNSCDKFLNKISEMADGKTPVRMLDYFHRVTLDVIGKVAFGADFRSIEDNDSPFTSAVSLTFQGLMLKIRGPLHKINPSTFKLQSEAADAVRFLRDAGKKIFEERKEATTRGETVPCDILSTLIKLNDSNMISCEDLLDHMLTILIGGQETAANQLSFLLLEVTQRPDIMKKLLTEINEVLGSRDYVEFDDLAKLQYMGQVLKETLRLYPPVVFIPRVTGKQVILNGHVIPTNTDVNISIFSAQRHPANFDDPEKFDPERWSPDKSAKIPHYGYLPFSLGPRNCIGQVFAQFETKVLLARFLNKFQVTLWPGQTRAILQHTTIRPKDGVVCTMVRRHKYCLS